jgi:multiple sugar transport system ATP-binding protein
MSISDEIVVMEAGVIRQTGRPQDIYDEPANLFVAKFLGTPPINVFEARAEAGRVYIGDAYVMLAPNVADGPLTVGVRPEGFVPSEDGPLACELVAVERMGRDTSIVAKHDAHERGQIRTIVASDVRLDTTSSTVRFGFKAEKTHLFDVATGERIVTDAIPVTRTGA